MKATYSFVFLAVILVTSAVATPISAHPGLQPTTTNGFDNAEMRREIAEHRGGSSAGTTPSHLNPAHHGNHDAPTKGKPEKHDHIHGSKGASKEESMSLRGVPVPQSHPSKSSGKYDNHSGKNSNHSGKGDHHNGKGDNHSGKGAKPPHSARGYHDAGAHGGVADKAPYDNQETSHPGIHYDPYSVQGRSDASMIHHSHGGVHNEPEKGWNNDGNDDDGGDLDVDVNPGIDLSLR